MREAEERNTSESSSRHAAAERMSAGHSGRKSVAVSSAASRCVVDTGSPLWRASSVSCWTLPAVNDVRIAASLAVTVRP